MLSSPVSVASRRRVEAGDLNMWRQSKGALENPVLWHFIIFFIIFLIPSVDGSWRCDCSSVASLCTQYTPSHRAHTHTLARTCARVCVCTEPVARKHTLNTLLLVLVNPRLLLPVYKWKGHRPSRGAAWSGGGVMTALTPPFWCAVI